MPNDLETKRTLWHQHITNWKSSGLTQRAFCEKHALNIHQFGYWNKRFNPAKSASPKSQDKNTAPNDGGFVSVKLSEVELSQALPYLELPNSIRIYGVHQLAVEYVAQLVNALR